MAFDEHFEVVGGRFDSRRKLLVSAKDRRVLIGTELRAQLIAARLDTTYQDYRAVRYCAALAIRVL